MLATGRVPVPLVGEVCQIRVTLGRLDNDMASVTTITTVRTTARDIFFTSEAHAAVAAVASANVNRDSINKHASMTPGGHARG
jgi:hypothetical protein